MSRSKQFVGWNRRIAARLTPEHIARASAYERFNSVAASRVTDESIRRIGDVGGGRTFHQEEALSQRKDEVMLLCIDIDPAEMALNSSADERWVADISSADAVLPTEVDLVLVRAGVEHFHDNSAALENIRRMLRSEGEAIMVFASRNALFAILNRLLPSRASSWLLKNLIPGSEGTLGFPAHYDRCTYRQYSEAARASGFEIVEYYPSYFSSNYFKFALPLYFASLCFNYLTFIIGRPSLASYHFFHLKKRSHVST